MKDIRMIRARAIQLIDELDRAEEIRKSQNAKDADKEKPSTGMTMEEILHDPRSTSRLEDKVLLFFKEYDKKGPLYQSALRTNWLTSRYKALKGLLENMVEHLDTFYPEASIVTLEKAQEMAEKLKAAIETANRSGFDAPKTTDLEIEAELLLRKYDRFGPIWKGYQQSMRRDSYLKKEKLQEYVGYLIADLKKYSYPLMRGDLSKIKAAEIA